MNDEKRRDDLRRQLSGLRREHEELSRSLPRHSIKPSQMMRLEDLEDEIEEIEAALARLGDG
jgi:hypothetical protein